MAGCEQVAWASPQMVGAPTTSFVGKPRAAPAVSFSNRPQAEETPTCQAAPGSAAVRPTRAGSGMKDKAMVLS